MVDAQTFNKNEANSSISVSSIDEELVNGEPTEEHLLLCTHQVPIFSFEDKSFYWADVNNIAEINFNDAAFDHLILPSSQKGLVRALVESYTRDESFDDYIAGMHPIHHGVTLLTFSRQRKGSYPASPRTSWCGQNNDSRRYMYHGMAWTMLTI